MKRNLLLYLLPLILFLGGCNVKKPPAAPTPSPSASTSRAEKYVNDEMGYSLPIIEGWVTPVGSDFGEFMVEYPAATFMPKPVFNIISTKVPVFDVHSPGNQQDIKDDIDRGLKCAREENILVDGKPAYQIIYGVEKDGKTLMIKQTYFFHKDHLIVTTGCCLDDKFSVYQPDFDKMLSSMSFK